MENLYRCLAARGLIATELDWKNAFRANGVGNGIAHIQDLGRILKNAGCYVCILKTPILWEQDIIKVLVMIKTKRDGDKICPCSATSSPIGHHRRKGGTFSEIAEAMMCSAGILSRNA